MTRASLFLATLSAALVAFTATPARATPCGFSSTSSIGTTLESLISLGEQGCSTVLGNSSFVWSSFTYSGAAPSGAAIPASAVSVHGTSEKTRGVAAILVFETTNPGWGALNLSFNVAALDPNGNQGLPAAPLLFGANTPPFFGLLVGVEFVRFNEPLFMFQLFSNPFPGTITPHFGPGESNIDVQVAGEFKGTGATGVAFIAPAPEPVTLALWGLTAGGLGWMARRRRRREGTPHVAHTPTP
jgi:hypothetical protein